jgi:type I restriction enzyme, S subunit
VRQLRSGRLCKGWDMSDDWPVDRLGKHCTVKARIGWRGLSASEYTDDGPFLIAGKHVRDGEIDWASCDHITEYRFRESMEIALDPGDVIITKDGTIGRVARVDHLPGKATLNGTMMLLRAGTGLEYRYLFHVLRGEQFKRLIDDKVSGSSIPHIFQRDMVTLPIALPPPAQQQGIANVLDALDASIRQTEAIIEKLKQVKQGLLHDLLTRGIDANGELRPPQCQAPRLYKDSPLGWIPLNWEAVRLENLLGDDDPAMRSGPFGSALLKHELVASGVPLLGIDNVQVERFDGNFSRFVSEKKFYDLERYSVRPHDLMITIMGTVGRCCVVPESIGRALSSKHTWTITLDRARYSPLLAMLQINYCEWASRQFAKDEQGGVMSAIRSETLRRLLLPTPPRAEQSEIELHMRAITARIDNEGAVLRKLVLQKCGLMDDLLTGRVRVTPLLADANRL